MYCFNCQNSKQERLNNSKRSKYLFPDCFPFQKNEYFRRQYVIDKLKGIRRLFRTHNLYFSVPYSAKYTDSLIEYRYGAIWLLYISTRAYHTPKTPSEYYLVINSNRQWISCLLCFACSLFAPSRKVNKSAWAVMRKYPSPPTLSTERSKSNNNRVDGWNQPHTRGTHSKSSRRGWRCTQLRRLSQVICFRKPQ